MGGSGVHGAMHGRINEDQNVGYNTFNCYVGYLAFQVFVWKGFGFPEVLGNNAGPVIDLRRLNQPTWTGAAYQIWPRPRPFISWPPPESLSVRTANAFHNRFFIP